MLGEFIISCYYFVIIFPDIWAAYVNLPTQAQNAVDNSSANKLPGNIVFEFGVFVFNFLFAASVHIASWNQIHVNIYDYFYI